MKLTAADLHALARDLDELDAQLTAPNPDYAGPTADSLRDRVHAWAVDADLEDARRIVATPEPAPKVWRLARKLSTRELSALEIYVFDVAHEAEPFPGRLLSVATKSGRHELTLEVDAVDDARAWLTEAANSADEAGDGRLRDALTGLAASLPRE